MNESYKTRQFPKFGRLILSFENWMLEIDRTVFEKNKRIKLSEKYKKGAQKWVDDHWIILKKIDTTELGLFLRFHLFSERDILEIVAIAKEKHMKEDDEDYKVGKQEMVEELAEVTQIRHGRR